VPASPRPLGGDADYELRLAHATIDRLQAELEAQTEELIDARSARGETAEAVALRRELGRLRGRLEAGESELAAARREIDRARHRSVAAASVATEEELRRARQQLDTYRDRVRELDQVVSALTVGLDATKRDLTRAADSFAWRLGHSITKIVRRFRLRPIRTEGALAVALKRIEQVEASTGRLPAAAGVATVPATPEGVSLPDPGDIEATRARREALAAEVRERLGPVAALDQWPPVSIVVINRDGRPHLEWLVHGLEATDYPQLELIVFDNGSSDDSVDFLEGLDVDFPVVVERSEENLTYSAANTRGAEVASHDLLLFLNNDVEPFEPGWLREMVAAHAAGADAVGATLLHVEEVAPEPTVQHQGIRLRREEGLVRAYNVGGHSLWGGGFGRELHPPAVSAACLLIPRPTLEAVGGFVPDYRYGSEDVDLGLALVAGGSTIVASGRAVLFHRESSTQRRAGRDFMRLNREVNRRVLHERWGPRLRREYRLSRLSADPEWTDGSGPHVAITVTSHDQVDGWGDWYTAHELGDALAERGWRVTYAARKGDEWLELPEDLDYLVTLMDVFDLRTVPDDVFVAAWIRNWTDRWLERPWLDRADLLLVSSETSARMVEQRTGRPTLRFPLATNPARFSAAGPREDLACDYVFTGNRWGKKRAIEDALDPRPGERASIYGKEWRKVRRLRPYDRGPAAYEDLPAIYASAKLVLDDTQGPTLPFGAVNARVFDALAAGALVLSNCETGLREIFDEEFPVWDSRQSLREQLDALLGDDERRAALAKRYRSMVLAEHTYAHRANQIATALREAEERLSFCIKIGAPDAEQAKLWGDLHFAEALKRQLVRRGHRCRIQTLDQWDLLEGCQDDVVIHLKGRSRYLGRTGQLNVLWCISHPDELSPEECDGYDLVLVAAPAFAEDLAARTATPVRVLEQATDPQRFYPEFDPAYAHQLVYVANSRGVMRPIPRDLDLDGHDLAIYGSNWEGLIETRHIAGEHVPNAELRKVYSSATVVLADHWDDMREHGFVANRIYDALACGATVISDDVAGLADRFDGAVLTYRTPEELSARIQELSSDPLARLARGARGRAAVLEDGDFSTRADELLALVAEAREATGAPDRIRAGAR
jgi:GT2 family glycosyltransferase/spore maturation protein CgeB